MEQLVEFDKDLTIKSDNATVKQQIEDVIRDIQEQQISKFMIEQIRKQFVNITSKHLREIFECKNYDLAYFFLSKGADPGFTKSKDWILEYWIEIFESPFDINDPYMQDDIGMLIYLIDNYPDLPLRETDSPMYPCVLSWMLKVDVISGIISKIILEDEKRIANFVRCVKLQPHRCLLHIAMQSGHNNECDSHAKLMSLMFTSLVPDDITASEFVDSFKESPFAFLFINVYYSKGINFFNTLLKKLSSFNFLFNKVKG